MIRRAGEADLARVREIVEAAYATWVPVVGRRPAPMDEDHAAQIGAGQVWLHGADALVVLEDRPQGLLVDNLAVHPSAQGKGLAGALIRFAEEEARRRGHGRLWLYTNERMERNVRLYGHLGFRETHRTAEAGFRRVYMEKSLP